MPCFLWIEEFYFVTQSVNHIQEEVQTLNAITDRRSIRKYTDRAVSKADIEKIIQAGILAPSAKNRQPWKYIVYTEEAKRSLIDEMEKGLLRERDGKKSYCPNHIWPCRTLFTP